MTSRLVTPADAVAAIRRRIDQKWAEAVCADLGVGDRVTFSVPLRPGVSTGKAVEQLGHATWHDWHMRWREITDQPPTGDIHDIAYRPRVVLVVENRDSRLWFPPVKDTIVVEGGYTILDQFRAALAEPAPASHCGSERRSRPAQSMTAAR